MTDNEIIKALECCGANRDCAGCPKEKEPYGCYFELCGGAFDLINRQKAEIERFQKAWEMFAYLNEAVHYVEIGGKVETVEFVSEEAKQKAINKKLDLLCNVRKAKLEAYKEFAERLCEDRVSNDPVVIAVKVELEKESERG